jgi:hypothetical protein
MTATPRTVRALAHSTPTVALSASDRGLLAEALRLGEETRNVMEDALVGFGRWLLVNVFHDDPAEALVRRRGNPVWVELLRRAGGPAPAAAPGAVRKIPKIFSRRAVNYGRSFLSTAP